MGYGMLHLSRSTRVVHGYEWILPHAFRKRLKKLLGRGELFAIQSFPLRLKMHIQYDIFEWVKRRPVRFVFPKAWTYLKLVGVAASRQVGETYRSDKRQLGSFQVLSAIRICDVEAALSASPKV